MKAPGRADRFLTTSKQYRRQLEIARALAPIDVNSHSGSDDFTSMRRRNSSCSSRD